MNIKIKKLHPDAIIPKYATPGAACFDLHACDLPDHGVTLKDRRPIIRTGLSFEVPTGYVMLVFSRSGHGFKHDVRLANCVGVIDSDYRGEVQVKLTADAALGFLTINNGDRIAQAIITPAQQVSFLEVDELTKTERGTGGFGSTGA